MNILAARRVRQFLKLTYPICITLDNGVFVGKFPDLPAGQLTAADIQALYVNLDRLRRDWLTEQVLAGACIPLPNSYLAPIPTMDCPSASPAISTAPSSSSTTTTPSSSSATPDFSPSSEDDTRS